jgi:hypothetical protein
MVSSPEWLEDRLQSRPESHSGPLFASCPAGAGRLRWSSRAPRPAGMDPRPYCRIRWPLWRAHCSDESGSEGLHAQAFNVLE